MLSSSSPLTPTPLEWRRMWRARGLLVDRMVPDAFAVPMLAEDVLRSRMPRTLQLPGVTTRTTVTEHDQNVALDVLKFVTGFVAEMLPAQIVLTDSKPSLPNAASALAVATVDGEQEFLGSFDFFSSYNPFKMLNTSLEKIS